MQDERIIFLALRARNYEDTARFYKDVLGVPVEEEDHSDEVHHYEYSWHNPYFHFAIFPASEDEEATRTELAFSVKDVQEVHRRAVAAGVRIVEAPRQEPWGFGATYIDPDGNSVGVYELSATKV
jgi:predicted enzyme related to lactoylglutathione lyase